MTRLLFTIFLGCMIFSCAAQSNAKLKNTVYEEVDFENVIKRYFGKSSAYSVEGMYSVSCLITKRNKKFLSRAERVRVVGRQDNYAKVAIMKDWPSSNRDFIEVSLSYRKANRFPIVGELNRMADGPGYVYSHIEPDGKRLTFSLLESDGLLEAEHSTIKRRKTITYKLSFLRIFPSENENVAAYERQ